MELETTTEASEQLRLEREVYLQERRELNEAEAEQIRSFDKSILTLSAGALGLSLTFIKDVVPKFGPCTSWSLYVGWACFVVSLLLTLSSFQISALAIRRQRAILDADQIGTDVGQRFGNLPARWTNGLNWASLYIFVFGAAMLTLFVALNVYQ